MIFDFHYWPMALVFAALSAALAFWFVGKSETSARSRSRSREEVPAESNYSKAISAALITFVLDLLIQRIWLYYGQPALTGSFFGYFSLLFLAIVPAAIIGNVLSDGRAALRSIAIVAGLFSVPIVQITYFSFGPNNARAFAQLPKIEIAGADETIPPSDEQHMVRVTYGMAGQKARTALSQKGNYSTLYRVGALTLQGIKGHRYYAAPMVPNNSIDTFWTPLGGGRAESPGFILVDAENTGAEGEVHDGFHISLFEDENWNMNVYRFIYQAGFNKGSLEPAKFEVDDNMQPHWVISYVTPAFGNIVGEVVDKVHVVSFSKEGPTLNTYAPGDVAIKWVDRVMPNDLVRHYARYFGTYGQPYATANWGNYLEVAWGLSKQELMMPADGEEGHMISYTHEDHNIYVLPMTSVNSGNNGVLGLLVFETDINKAKFYPGLRGFNHAESASHTMFGVNQNTTQKCDVGNLELYNIYGHLTWTAILTRSQASGATFCAIAFMNAHDQQVSDVAYGTDLQAALSDYSNKLANGSHGMEATGANDQRTFDGVIWRIGPNGSGWRFQLFSDEHYFNLNDQNYLGAPLLRDGDHVTGSYMDTHQQLVTVRELTLVGGKKAVANPAPAAAPLLAPAPKQ